jgi:hypothetical protein
MGGWALASVAGLRRVSGHQGLGHLQWLLRLFAVRDLLRRRNAPPLAGARAPPVREGRNGLARGEVVPTATTGEGCPRCPRQ